MIIFDNIEERSYISRLDPRVRVACTLLFSFLICLCRNTSVLITGLSSAVLMTAISGIPPMRILKRLAALNSFMLLLMATMPLFMAGKTLFSIAGLIWSIEGFSRALLITARANAVMLMLIALLDTMETAHLGFALKKLGVPDKFVHLLLFMVRYIDIIHHEYHHLRDAMLLRAFRPRFNRHTFRTFGFLTGQLLVRSVNRSERIMEAMKCRCFRGRFYILTPCRIEIADITFALTSLAGISALIIWELSL